MANIDQTQINKFFKLQKAFLFPYGVATSSFFWISFFLTVYPIVFDGDPFYWWGKLLIVIAGILIIALINYHVNFVFQKRKGKGLVIYLMILPEDWEFDKFVHSDIQSDMQRRFTSDSVKCTIEVPNILKRYQIMRQIENHSKRGEDYFQSSLWKKLHKRIKGNFYIFGKLKERNSRGVNNLAFSGIQMVVAHSDKVNTEHISELQKALNEYCISNVLIERSYEYELLTYLSTAYANIIEFLLGIAFLISGYPLQAYALHMKIVSDSKSGIRNEQLSKDAKKYLRSELLGIVHILLTNERINEAIAVIGDYESKCCEDDRSRNLYAKALIMRCENQEQYQRFVPEAIEALANVAADEESRPVLLHNRAYLFLLSSRFSEAEKALKAAHKYSSGDIYANILEYCDWVLTKETKVYERGVALLTRARALKRISKNSDEIIKAFESVIEYYQGDESCYFVISARNELKLL